jgi:hypothetical protein
VLVVGGGALACVSTLMPWYRIAWSGGTVPPGSSAWAGLTGTTGLVTLIMGVILVGVGVKYATLPVTERRGVLRGAMMGAAWLLVLSAILGPGEIVDHSSEPLEAASATGAALHRGGAIGATVALLAGLIALAGAWLTIVENTSGVTVHDAMTRNRRRRRGRDR